MINKKYWHTCQISGIDIKSIARKYGGANIYYTDAFVSYLLAEHNISIDSYFRDVCQLVPPKCSCNICNKELKVTKRGANFKYFKYACGRNHGIMSWSKKAKVDRLGYKNPMFNKTPWNKNHTKYTHPSVMSISINNTNKKMSVASRRKMSQSYNKNIIRHAMPHSKETIEKLRQITINRIKSGKIKFTKTKPHQIFKKILQSLKIKFVEEYNIEYWLFDFYLTEYNIFIEVDGDYWHSNPLKYPNGPKTNAQKRNYARDCSKNKFAQQNKLCLIRFWEFDIINNSDKIICKLQKLLKLN